VAPPGTVLFAVLVGFAIFFPALAHLGAVLVHPEPVLELLGPALLLGRRVSFAFLLAERVKFRLQRVVTRSGITRLSHGGSPVVYSSAGG
jgi:hypothetical protein